MLQMLAGRASRLQSSKTSNHDIRSAMIANLQYSSNCLVNIGPCALIVMSHDDEGTFAMVGSFSEYCNI